MFNQVTQCHHNVIMTQNPCQSLRSGVFQTGLPEVLNATGA